LAAFFATGFFLALALLAPFFVITGVSAR
jgi:hypothetical protein